MSTSLEEFLSKVTFKLASEIKDTEIVCRITDHNVKYDRHGRPTLVLIVNCLNHGKVVISLSPSYAREFGERLKRLGIERVQDMYQHCFIWERYQLPKAREDYTIPHPRFLPVKIVKCPEQLEKM